MDLQRFCGIFNAYFPLEERFQPTLLFEQAFARSFFDPYFAVPGMSSLKKLKVLQIAYGLLTADEAYLEVGCWKGKSLLHALLGNTPRRTYACDNFSKFGQPDSLDRLMKILAQYGVRDRVEFYEADFREIMNKEKISVPLGVYFYDGAHDAESQFQAIKLVEPLLADQALVIIDDWVLDPTESVYMAKPGTMRALRESANEWTLLYELPARWNCDHGTWWNGLGILGFHRRT